MEKDFSIICHNCEGEVNGWVHNIRYVLQPDTASQAEQTIKLSCGCAVDFPDWKINLITGECKILDYTGRLFIEFIDKEMILEEEDE